jgi:fructose-1-phosphate kinase PfkB-like protein
MKFISLLAEIGISHKTADAANQERMKIKINNRQKEMKVQVGFLTFKIVTIQEKIMAKDLEPSSEAAGAVVEQWGQ